MPAGRPFRQPTSRQSENPLGLMPLEAHRWEAGSRWRKAYLEIMLRGNSRAKRVRRQKTLSGVSQRLAGTIDSTMIGRDQSITLRQAGGRGQPRQPRGGGKTAGDELAA